MQKLLLVTRNAKEGEDLPLQKKEGETPLFYYYVEERQRR